MHTSIYMVRHGESPTNEGNHNERTRGLTEKGKRDALQVAETLKQEEIEVFVSSPYLRAILTIEDLAGASGQEVLLYEDLKERIFLNEDKRLPDEELIPLLELSFVDPDFALPGGESNADCQGRAIAVVKELLKNYKGRKIALGTHGAVMTLIMNHYDKKYDLDFLLNMSKPDVYRLDFNGEELVNVFRLWK
ncbi:MULTISPECIES: histidine phosphatase family protein [unclassified Paenibacillus]|uniref:histidine phosphatase family protein n=1 Tax=unclassified Paenibacillus TaxID=185978 RepID=UPI002405B45D|nr:MULTISPECIES: histidine phosphatase family protein [unclassified Paenibacillus]MDF9841146.1 2,3-bisphosphoglycerate-dependent phosphoglycerate mutase [Paenibacillus sp. PastF-2]MDF9847682.1 2,3-bisphosphoglycerate-dependent phosphoglycerate mutase [Paenibacillus sp. PastM-2]MDF9854251.1 2,3-bisphosphoglycerate-dependent phosphoglycerate mutase [Paenibacillus sp. PastF-1]MDH6479578.1 2,3-bisphosphoglycerate-dependent phosphoglycerate mutase [Paenibacillus sp. PastH-2]MDH6505243.1 2,3-bisphos